MPGAAMSVNPAPAPRLIALRIVGGILAYGFLAGFVGLIGMQIYHWFRDGQWTHIGISDALLAILNGCCVREDGSGTGLFVTLSRWLDQPTDWLGWHRLLGAIPASIGLFLLSVLGNFLYIYSGDRIDGDRIDGERPAEPPA